VSAAAFSDYLLFVDESGDHGMVRLDPDYPIFALACCLIAKSDYVERITPALQRLKHEYWGHDEQVLHEHEIRKPNKDYSFLFDPDRRQAFLAGINRLVEQAPFKLVAAVIRKVEFAKRYAIPENPYDLALQFCLERVAMELRTGGQGARLTQVIVEKRGRREDDALELAFRRIRDGRNALEHPLPFELTMIPKSANSAGLQLADLVVRPVGIKVLRPDQANRAYEIVEGKLRRSPAGEVRGWGLKVFP
jgi:hypothetical protein